MAAIGGKGTCLYKADGVLVDGKREGRKMGGRGRLWVRVRDGRNMCNFKKGKRVFMKTDMMGDVDTIRRQVKTIIT
jgi:hypothetical protein